MATVSIKNVNKIAPLWYRKLKKVINIGLVPSAVLTIKGLWTGSDAYLNKVLILITITLPALIEIIGMVLADGDDGGGQEITTTESDTATVVNVNTPTPKQ